MGSGHLSEDHDSDDRPDQMRDEEPNEAHALSIDAENEETEGEPHEDLSQRAPPERRGQIEKNHLHLHCQIGVDKALLDIFRLWEESLG